LNAAPGVQIASGLRYDGGPANPVPFPTPDVGQANATKNLGTGVTVSLKRTEAVSPYKFKAYGEK
jgi:hypothetical protein